MLLYTLACTQPVETAPPTFDELNAGALVEFHTDGGEEYVLGLRDWLLEHRDEWTTEDWGGGYRLGVVGEEDLGAVEHSENTNWAEVFGVGVPLEARGDVSGYAEAATEPDQTFADPSTYIRWDRTITEGSAEAFLAGDDMKTDNVVEKSGPFGIVIPYESKKDFRWFGDVLAAITWVPEEGWAEDGENGLICGFTIELWWDEDGQTIFYNGGWQQIATVIGDDFPEDVLIDTFIDGTLDYMLGTEAYVMGEYTPPE